MSIKNNRFVSCINNDKAIEDLNIRGRTNEEYQDEICSINGVIIDSGLRRIWDSSV